MHPHAEIAEGLHWSDVDCGRRQSAFQWMEVDAGAGLSRKRCAPQNLGFVRIKLQPI